MMIQELQITNSGDDGKLVIGYYGKLPLVDETLNRTPKIDTWTSDSIKDFMTADNRFGLSQVISQKTFDKVIHWIQYNANNLDNIEET